MESVNSLQLSIIILSYNSKTDLERLLPSIEQSEGGFGYEVIVVDNGSGDGTGEWLEQVKSEKYNVQSGKQDFLLSTLHFTLIRNANNGFAQGNNLGIKIAKGKYLLILNPDTKLQKDTLKVMLEFMKAHPEVGIGTCKVLLPDGKLDLACRRRFPNPWNSFLRLLRISNADYNMLDTDENESQEIDSCMGAFMMIRQEVLKKLPELKVKSEKFKAQQDPPPTLHFTPYTNHWAFDESYFMYGEDIDLCWRVKEAGYKVWYFPKTSITHYKGSSSKKTPFKALKWFHDAMWIFYKKHYAKKYPFILNWLVWFGVYTRLAGLVVINAFKRDRKVSG